MKKFFMFCLFMILSLEVFAQKLNTNGESHFDQLVGVKFTKPYYQDGENYDGVILLYYTTKIKN